MAALGKEIHICHDNYYYHHHHYYHHYHHHFTALSGSKLYSVELQDDA
jgi:hypothetical protein